MRTTTEPVTVMLSRSVRVGQERAFEAALSWHLERVQRLSGHLGVDVFEPAAGSRRWTFIFKFQTVAQANAWKLSPEREAWEAKAAELTDGAPRLQVTTGLEAWFTTPDLGVSGPPPRWKLAIATWVVIYPTITALLLAIGPVIESWPTASRTFLLTAVLVPLMTFALMPAATRALRSWLYN